MTAMRAASHSNHAPNSIVVKLEEKRVRLKSCLMTLLILGLTFEPGASQVELLPETLHVSSLPYCTEIRE